MKISLSQYVKFLKLDKDRRFTTFLFIWDTDQPDKILDLFKFVQDLQLIFYGLVVPTEHFFAISTIVFTFANSEDY